MPFAKSCVPAGALQPTDREATSKCIFKLLPCTRVQKRMHRPGRSPLLFTRGRLLSTNQPAKNFWAFPTVEKAILLSRDLRRPCKNWKDARPRFRQQWLQDGHHV